jgi:hypothetical protein
MALILDEGIGQYLGMSKARVRVFQEETGSNVQPAPDSVQKVWGKGPQSLAPSPIASLNLQSNAPVYRKRKGRF